MKILAVIFLVYFALITYFTVKVLNALRGASLSYKLIPIAVWLSVLAVYGIIAKNLLN